MIRLRIREAIEARGLSMTKLSQRSEVSFTTIKSLIRDPYRSVNTETLDRLAKALGISVFELMEDVSEEEAQREYEFQREQEEQPSSIETIEIQPNS
jgi:transcriptional regulator with XRE-family HTH domain